MTNISSIPKKLMSININHSLPSVNQHIGNPENAENYIRVLVDTGAVINAGNLKYHMWVML